MTAGKPRIADSSLIVPLSDSMQRALASAGARSRGSRTARGRRCRPARPASAPAPRAACGCGGGWRPAPAAPTGRGPPAGSRAAAEPVRVVDVLLAVRADQEVAARVEIRAGRARRTPRSAAVVLEHLAHRRAGVQDPARVQALGEQVASGVLGVDEVEVGDVVDQPAVGLLRDVLVEAAVAGLHVVDRHPHPPGHQRGDAAVGVAEHEHRVRPRLGDRLLRRRSARRRAPGRATRCRPPGSGRAARRSSSSKKTSVQRRSQFWPVWTSTWSTVRSSRSITRDSRMISGRVPTTVMTRVMPVLSAAASLVSMSSN